MKHPEFVVAGAGRSGTRYLAHALTAAGIPTGHEAFYRPDPDTPPPSCPRDAIGDVSWLATPHAHRIDVPLIHALRHPLAIITSQYHRPIRFDKPWGRYFLRHYDPPSLDPLHMAVWSTATFIRTLETHARQTVRVEDREYAVAAIADAIGRTRTASQLEAAALVSTDTNRHHREDWLAWETLPDTPDVDYILEVADRYRYTLA